MRAVVEDVWIDDAGAVIVAARPKARERHRCPFCRRRCPGYDRGEGRRRWRALDLGTTFAYVDADAPRVECASMTVSSWPRCRGRAMIVVYQGV